MKHARSIDLSVTESVEQLAEWHLLEGCCGKCGHVGKVYWSRIKSRFMPSELLSDVENRFRCRTCGNRRQNRIVVTMMVRD